MVRFTIVGRLRDGLPLAQGPRDLNEANESFSFYKHQGEFILKEISRGALPHSRMSVRLNHHSFNFLVENGICFITLCDASYPRKLVFHYLQDLHQELDKFDISLLDRITEPYSFVKFDSVIGDIRKRYVDTRTQANLSKLSANRGQNLDIITENMSQTIARRRISEMFERSVAVAANPGTVPSSIWCSPRLVAIALIWTPITLIAAVSSVL